MDTWWASPLLPWISLGALFGLNQLDCCRQLHYLEIIEICRQSHEQYPCLPSHVCKVNGSSVARFRNRTTSIIDWYLVRWGLKSKHHKDTCLQDIGLHLQLLTTTLHSIVYTIGRTYVSSWPLVEVKQIGTTLKHLWYAFVTKTRFSWVSLASIFGQIRCKNEPTTWNLRCKPDTKKERLSHSKSVVICSVATLLRHN